MIINNKTKIINKGQIFEKIAEDYLQKQNICIISKNFSCKCGEIDLIATENNTIIFVEVRYRKNIDYGLPVETVSYTKQQKILKTAQIFLLKNPQFAKDYNPRFDIIGLWQAQNKLQVDWVKNAFGS